MGLIGALIVGLLAGLIASWIMPGGANGCIWNTLLGLAGGVVGGWVANALNIATPETWWMNVIIGVVGACILIAIYNMFSKKR